MCYTISVKREHTRREHEMIHVFDECTGDEFKLENSEQIAEFRQGFSESDAWMWDEMVDLYTKMQQIQAKLAHLEAMTNLTISR